MKSKDYIYKNEGQFYLVTMWENGKVTLKIKEQGWSDTWSASLDECDPFGRVKLEAQTRKLEASSLQLLASRANLES